MRAQATGYAGDPNVSTPYLDKLASESARFTTAVSSCPICTPYRACLLTGRYPLTHGLFMNDLCLNNEAPTFAKIYAQAGYDTAYIGKWHLDGHGRRSYIPPERRQGFDYWKVLECTHEYFDSWYYEGNDENHKVWDGYDALAQANDAAGYISTRADNRKPFVLMISFGPPHNPYDDVPPDYLNRYDASKLELRPNVPADLEEVARESLRGYYAHITALDECVRRIDTALHEANLARNTIFVFTSDHGDSVESNCRPEHPSVNKQRPYDESILVPFLLRWPGASRPGAKTVSAPFAPPDILPTLLGLSGVDAPKTIEGVDFSPAILGTEDIARPAVLIAGYSPFADWRRGRGGREYRGVRTERYTYVRDLRGPWLLFDNENDPYQMSNLVGRAEYRGIEADLRSALDRTLREQSDGFLPAEKLREKWGYTDLDHNDSVRYWN